jgi:parvulin-like peptidyl-prolyl isomerase
MGMKIKNLLGMVVLLAAVIALAALGCNKNKPGEGKDGGGKDGGGKDGGVSLGSTAPDAPVKPKGPDPVWIKVNGTEIHKSEVDKQIASLVEEIQSMGGQVKPEMGDLIKREGMQRAARIRLLSAAADKAGFTVEPKEIDDLVAADKAGYTDAIYFDNMLKERGITEEEYRQDRAMMLKINKYFDKMVPIADPTDEEVQKVYDEHKDDPRMMQPAKVNVIHILLRVNNPEEKEKKRELADSVRKRAEGGEDMSALAMEVSDSPSRGGGGKENFVKGQMGGDFDEKVFALKDGELSPVIESPAGFHLLKIVGITPERKTQIDEIKPQIIEMLKGKQKSELYPKYITGLETEAKIEYLEPLPEEKMPEANPGGPGPETGSTAPGKPGPPPGPPPAPEAPKPEAPKTTP